MANTGLLCFLPIICKYGIDELICPSAYPETWEITRQSAILSFLALKLSNVRRWLVEKSIAKQVDYFHLNRLSSSKVIKVDFDVVMTVFSMP